MCIAGYVLLWTGLGLSYEAAGYLRNLLVALAGIGLLFIACRVASVFFSTRVKK